VREARSEGISPQVEGKSIQQGSFGRCVLGMIRKRTPPSLADLLQHAGWTRQLARGLVGSDLAADDVLQDTWLAALRHPPDPGRPLRPWLGTVIRNKVFNRSRERARRRAREARADESGGSESAESLLGRLEIHKILVDVVSELGEPYRQTILLAYFEELSSAEIGERSNVPASTIRGRLKTALELLREALDVRLGGRSAWLLAVTDLSHLPRPPARAQPGGARASVGSGGTVAGGAGGGVLIPAAVGLVALVAAATIWSVAKGRVSSQQSTASAEGAPSGSELAERGAPSAPIGALSIPPFRSASVAPPMAPFSLSSRLGLPPAGSTISGVVLAGEPEATRVASRVGRGGVVADAVVRIFGAGPIGTDRSVSTMTPTISEGRFFPRVLLVVPGEPLVLQNADDVPHVVSVTREAVELFKASIPAHERATVPTPRGMEVLRLQVLDGGSRASFVVPSDRGLGCKTDADGAFALLGVPTGRYTLEVWDETLGTRSVEVTVPFIAQPLRVVFGSEPPLPLWVSRGSTACTIAFRGDGPIAKSCASGGRDAAKRLMKEIVKQAKLRGKQFTCEGCHKDLEDFDLTASAREDLEKMLASVRHAP
jgi:RNA polymerase sigma-70 factor (ECF subfamily)